MSRMLFPLSLGTVLLTGWVLHAAGWFRGHAALAATSPMRASASLVHSQAALRYQQCQPRHWRYLMLQH
jgi:hypothetical protein